MLGRFVPVVRTFLNPLAGVVGVSAGRFSLWNAVGGLGWPALVLLLGYALGGALPRDNIDTYLLPIVAAIVVISLVPIGMEIRRSRQR